jgi:hypothetical protein
MSPINLKSAVAQAETWKSFILAGVGRCKHQGNAHGRRTLFQ